MKFKYIGDCEGFEFRGIKFPIGVSVDVTDKDAIGKLEGNSHFEKTKTRKKATPEKLVVNNGNSGGHTE